MARICSAVLVALLAGSQMGCEPAPYEGPWNVILISIDTLRADHLGCYGYEHPTSPEIDRFCAQSWVFENATAHAPSTLLSHAAMLTSLVPQHHGASAIREIPLSPEVPTLASVLRDAGWATASFNSGGQVSASFGLGHGFDHYESGGSLFRWAVEATFDWIDLRTYRAENAFLEEQREQSAKPFFLFLHSYEIHHPYTPEPDLLEIFDQGYEGDLPEHISIDLLNRINSGELEIDEADLDHIRATYDAEIRSMDRSFGRLMEGLRQRGLLDRTLIVLTSDHGEEFGEHGMVGWHSHTLYQEMLWVPLVIGLPRSEASEDGARRLATLPVSAQIEQRVRSIDIAPTVLEVLGLPAQASFSGRSLLAMVKGEATEETEIHPTIGFWDGPDGVLHESLMARKWKLHEDELYDLESDPAEKVDLAAEHPELATRMRQRLERIVASREAAESEQIELDPETEEQLRALGYID